MEFIERLETELKNNPISPGEDGFIVNMKFFQQIEEAKISGKSVGQVNNKSFLKQKQIKTGLIYKTDFDVVSYTVWEYISENFGGGPEIKVTILPDGTPEIYPMHIIVTFKKINHDFKVSRKCLMEDFLQKVLSSFNLSQTSKAYLSLPSGDVKIETTGPLYSNLKGCTKFVLNIETVETNAPPPQKVNTTHLSKAQQRAFKRKKAKAEKLPEQVQKEMVTKKYCGLRNVGNTCYMNSALQCFLSSDYLIEKIDKILSESKDGLITSTFWRFVKECQKATSAVDPSPIKRRMGTINSIFKSRNQQDSHEFISFLIDSLHDEGPKGGEIEKLFFGEMKSDTLCKKCGAVSTVNEKFTTLSLPIVKPKRYIISPYDTNKPMYTSSELPEKYILFGKTPHGIDKIIEDQNLSFDFLIALEYPSDAAGIPITINLTENGKFITTPRLLIFDPSKKISEEELKETVIDRIKPLWMDSTFISSVKIIKFDPMTAITVEASREGMDLNRLKPIDPMLAISDLIRAFESPVQLDEKNEWRCEKCGKLSCAVRNTRITRAPDVLVLQIKRFSGGARGRRDGREVAIPFSTKICGERFELCAVSNHAGTLNMGHYTAIGRRDGVWFNFNDSQVTSAGPTFSEGRGAFSSSAAYVLFYERAKPKLIEINDKENEADIDKEESEAF